MEQNFQDESISQSEELEGNDAALAEGTVDRVYLTRDPEDVVTISSLFRAVWVLFIILTLSVGINVFFAFRKADRIIVDKSTGRVTEINNRDYGVTETVSMSPDIPTDTDKKYVVKEFLTALYEVKQTTRESRKQDASHA